MPLLIVSVLKLKRIIIKILIIDLCEFTAIYFKFVSLKRNVLKSKWIV